jgi:hypothetical protein
MQEQSHKWYTPIEKKVSVGQRIFSKSLTIRLYVSLFGILFLGVIALWKYAHHQPIYWDKLPTDMQQSMPSQASPP